MIPLRSLDSTLGHAALAAMVVAASAWAPAFQAESQAESPAESPAGPSAENAIGARPATPA